MPRRGAGGLLGAVRRARRAAYTVARGLGNVQPYVELSPRRVVRRIINRRLGRWGGSQMFGRGLISRAIRALLGL